MSKFSKEACSNYPDNWIRAVNVMAVTEGPFSPTEGARGHLGPEGTPAALSGGRMFSLIFIRRLPWRGRFPLSDSAAPGEKSSGLPGLSNNS